MDAQTTEDIVAIGIATLPSLAELAKLRRIYIAVAVFIPDAPWPRARCRRGRDRRVRRSSTQASHRVSRA